MQDDILKQLKTLKKIAPDPEFAVRLRRIVLAAPAPMRMGGIFAIWPKLVLGAATLAIIVLILEVPGAPKAVPIASAEALNNEFKNLSINIEVQQVSYNKSANQTISSALSEIASNGTNHLNPAVLQAESQSINPNAPASDPQIDTLLKEVTQ